MRNTHKTLRNLTLPLSVAAFVILQLQAQIAAQTTTIPEAYAIPSALADTSKPGFIFRISTIAENTSRNSLATAEKQLAGLLGNNLADPAAVNMAVGPAQPANPASAPLNGKSERVTHSDGVYRTIDAAWRA